MYLLWTFYEHTNSHKNTITFCWCWSNMMGEKLSSFLELVFNIHEGFFKHYIIYNFVNNICCKCCSAQWVQYSHVLSYLPIFTPGWRLEIHCGKLQLHISRSCLDLNLICSPCQHCRNFYIRNIARNTIISYSISCRLRSSILNSLPHCASMYIR